VYRVNFLISDLHTTIVKDKRKLFSLGRIFVTTCIDSVLCFGFIWAT